MYFIALDILDKFYKNFYLLEIAFGITGKK